MLLLSPQLPKPPPTPPAPASVSDAGGVGPCGYRTRWCLYYKTTVTNRHGNSPEKISPHSACAEIRGVFPDHNFLLYYWAGRDGRQRAANDSTITVNIGLFILRWSVGESFQIEIMDNKIWGDDANPDWRPFLVPRLPSYRNAAPPLCSLLGENLVDRVLGVQAATGCIKLVTLFIIQNRDIGSIRRSRLSRLFVKEFWIDGEVRGRPRRWGITREWCNAAEVQKHR